VALRLPPYNCDLSPIELAWTAVKRFIQGNNVGAEFSLNRLRDLTDAAISLVTKHDWKRYCHHVKTIEEAYYKKDGILSDVVERIVISNPNEENSSGDEKDEAQSSEKNELRFVSDLSDSELACPLD